MAGVAQDLQPSVLVGDVDVAASVDHDVFAAFLARSLADSGDKRVRLLDLDPPEIPCFPPSFGKARRYLRVNTHASDAPADHDVEPQLIALAPEGIQGARVGNGGQLIGTSSVQQPGPMRTVDLVSRG
ncbi:MAG TPA: hypothetical protein VN888_17570 [Mycobacterium sp.]|nr:hypothetical protein [Mycobacterium sp.]